MFVDGDTFVCHSFWLTDEFLNLGRSPFSTQLDPIWDKKRVILDLNSFVQIV